MSKLQTNGLTLAFTTNPWIAKIVNISQDGETAEDVDTSDLSTGDTRTYEPGELKEGGTYTFLVHFDPEQTRLATGVSDIATITYPLSNSGNSSQATEVFPTYINSWAKTGEINNLIQATLQIKVAGTPVFTPET